MTDLSQVLLYVDDFDATLDSYARAFDLPVRWRAGTMPYAWLGRPGRPGRPSRSGAVCVAAAGFVASGLPVEFRRNSASEAPAGFNLSLQVEDVPAAYRRAVDAGAVPVVEPTRQPWGQVTGWVRDCNGTLVELGEPWSPPE